MGEPVQQRPGEALRAEDLGPFVEWQVGGDQDGAPFVALAEDLEEQFRPGPGQWDKARFVDDQQVQAGQLPLQIQQPSLVPGLHHFVDQGGGRGEAQRHPPLAGGLGPEPRGRRQVTETPRSQDPVHSKPRLAKRTNTVPNGAASGPLAASMAIEC